MGTVVCGHNISIATNRRRATVEDDANGGRETQALTVFATFLIILPSDSTLK
jgi:hypothetical protein